MATWTLVWLYWIWRGSSRMNSIKDAADKTFFPLHVSLNLKVPYNANYTCWGFPTMTCVSSVSFNSLEMEKKKKNPSLSSFSFSSPLSKKKKRVLRHTFLAISHLWCHKELWNLSQVSGNRLSQVFLPLGPPRCQISRLWLLRWSTGWKSKGLKTGTLNGATQCATHLETSCGAFLCLAFPLCTAAANLNTAVTHLS